MEDQKNEAFYAIINKMIFHMGWARHLVVESIADHPEIADIVRIRRNIPDYSETDIVGLFSEDDFILEKISLRHIRLACRDFLNQRNLIS